MVALEHSLVNHVVLGQSTLDLVTVGIVHAAYIDVGLDDETIAHAILMAQVLAHTDDSENHFVTQHHRVGLHIAVDARVLLAQPDDLDVRKAQPTGVVTHQ